MFDIKSLLLMVSASLLLGCSWEETTSLAASADEPVWKERRAEMVVLLRAYGIADEAVLEAMSVVWRHKYIPDSQRVDREAYGDHPCPIGHGQTISQPYIVAYMTEKMGIKKGEKVLEIGTGSGYQAAILAELGAIVYSIEIVPELAKHASTALSAEGYDDVHVLAGDGYKGWPDRAPFDVIIVTCAPEEIPEALVKQLDDNGRMILPAGGLDQHLYILNKKHGKVEVKLDQAVRFVPMVRGKKR